MEAIAEKRVSINEQIRAATVRLIGVDGAQLGIVPLKQAIETARVDGLDLVEVSGGSVPPVCRIMDYGRFKYQQAKKVQEARRKSAQVSIKEVKIRPKTEEHDLGVKLRQARTFLEQGNRLKLSMMFRGREMAYAERAKAKLVWFTEQLADLAQVEGTPKLEGRHLTLVMTPKGGG